jgi:hypoxanthine phosphoribosyltransferase
MSKQFISAEDLLRDSFELGMRVLESGFRPTFLLGVWRGGTPVGIAVQELFEIYGLKMNHFAIRTSSYGSGMVASDTVQVFGLQHVVDTINVDDKLLIIDDVFDSGRSISAILENLQAKSRRNTPDDIKVATVYYKPGKNKTQRVPDFYIHEVDDWLVFPHEMKGCTLEELAEHKPLPKRAFDLKLEL